MSNHTLILAAALGGSALFTLTVDLRGETLNEDFEAYAPGTFPSPPWQDIGLLDPTPPNPPNPSATVEVTTDAVGEQTQVLEIFKDIGGPTQGIYQIVGESCYFRVAADVRIEQWADPPKGANPAADWAACVSLVQISDQDIALSPDTSIYAASLTHGWRVFSFGTAGTISDFSLNTPITIGRWYRVQMELETASGDIGLKIWDLSSDTLLLDNSTVLPGWTAEDGHYDAVAVSEGELSEGLTQANRAVVDNVHVQVGPCPWDCGNNDSDVGIVDFLALLAQWGGAGSCDFDGGGVGINDFLDLLANWGPCP